MSDNCDRLVAAVTTRLQPDRARHRAIQMRTMILVDDRIEKLEESNTTAAMNAANMLYAVLRGYRHGIRGTCPPDFDNEWAEARKQLDPEYAEYLRLKEKFE